MDSLNRTILIVALTVLAAALIWAVIWCAWFVRHAHFECPSCRFTFKPRLRTLIFATNAGPGKIITCPRCGKKDYMEPSKDMPPDKKNDKR